MKRFLLTAVLLFLCGASQALELAGVKLVDSVQIGNESLQLNGAGIRTGLFFKIYVGALYLPEKQTSAEAVIADVRGSRM
ncbi:MAG: chalcone isomerase family protein, partial [Gallionella sp.]